MATRLLGFITHRFQFPFSLQCKTDSPAAAETLLGALRRTAPRLHWGLLASRACSPRSICPAPYPRREGPSAWLSLGTADKGWVPDTPPFTQKGRLGYRPAPEPAIHLPAFVNHQEPRRREMLFLLQTPQRPAPSCTSASQSLRKGLCRTQAPAVTLGGKKSSLTPFRPCNSLLAFLVVREERQSEKESLGCFSNVV